MNKERMLILADALEHRKFPPAFGFNMAFGLCDIITARHDEPDAEIYLSKSSDCGTVGCIAGLACLLFDMDEGAPVTSAAVALDLCATDSGDLFIPSSLNLSYNNITPEAAGKVVRRFAETGVVDWSIMW